MKADKESTAGIEVGSIVQLIGEVPDFGGALAVVETIYSWGVEGDVHPVGLRNLSWAMIEPTGGKAIFGRNGLRRREPEETLKHHP